MDTEIAYNQALDYLYSFVDYSLKKSSELARADFHLERMFELMESLGNPQKDYPIIHVAGTKGKGSTSALAAAALQAAGFRTGLYTSPHLQDYVERIQVDRQPISHAELVDLVERARQEVARIPRLTTFEITTAIGLLYFSRQKVDAAVVEVGLGGRLDATNVVLPKVAVITSLSYDHMAVLGNTLTAIAGEKAGIIKPGVPVVSSPQKEEALLVLERIALERQAPLTLVGRDVFYEPISHSLDGQELQVWTAAQKPVKLTLPLLGAHQVANAATAYAALKAGGFRLTEMDIRKGFSRVYWPCRFEVVRRVPPVVLDSAHNADSFEKLEAALQDYFPGKRVSLVFGSSEDKDIAAMLRILKPRLARLIVTKAEHPRALEARKLLEIAQELQLSAVAAVPVETALKRALEASANDGSIVLSAGSMFVTTEARTAWEKYAKTVNIGALAG